LTLEGATDRLVFDAYVTQALLPHLRPGQVVVLDNLSAHKGERIRHLVEAVGCRLLFLPAYSPDFNPIEHTFAKLKAHLRRLAARTFETLLAAIGAAFDAVAAADAHAFFAHCGFPLQDQEL
jgi:transposase